MMGACLGSKLKIKGNWPGHLRVYVSETDLIHLLILDLMTFIFIEEFIAVSLAVISSNP